MILWQGAGRPRGWRSSPSAWKPRIAMAAVDAAIAELGPELALDPLIRAAL
jgi:hypothetical protein